MSVRTPFSGYTTSNRAQDKKSPRVMQETSSSQRETLLNLGVDEVVIGEDVQGFGPHGERRADQLGLGGFRADRGLEEEDGIAAEPPGTLQANTLAAVRHRLVVKMAGGFEQ